MKLIVHLFGPMREAAGSARVEVAVTPPATAADVVRALGQARPEVAPLLDRSRISVNHAYAEAATPIDPRDEVAIIPPVGGG